MKQFDLEEQQWILKILQIGESDEAVLTNVFADVLLNKGVAINLDSGALLYDMEKYKDINDIIAIQKIIIKRALLIKYLEEHHYIYIINDSPESIPVVGDKFKTSIAQKLPTEIADILRRTTYRIYADSSLRAFVGQSFKTTDEITIEEARKQTKYARYTLVATVISLFLTLVFSIITWFTSPSKNQAQELIQEVKYTQPLISNFSESAERQLKILIKGSRDIVMQNDTIIQTSSKQTKMLNQINRNMNYWHKNQN
jgi:hypothetical protein